MARQTPYPPSGHRPAKLTGDIAPYRGDCTTGTGRCQASRFSRRANRARRQRFRLAHSDGGGTAAIDGGGNDGHGRPDGGAALTAPSAWHRFEVGAASKVSESHFLAPCGIPFSRCSARCKAPEILHSDSDADYETRAHQMDRPARLNTGVDGEPVQGYCAVGACRPALRYLTILSARYARFSG